MPFLTDKDRELLEWIKEFSKKHDIKIEMPTHDHMTVTGRMTPELRKDLEFHWPTFGRKRVFVESKKPPMIPFNIDYEQLELRIAALTRPGIETVELGGRTYHRINHPYGGPSLEVPCRKNDDHGCPTCRLLEQLAVDRKAQMAREQEEQGTTVECKDCKQPFLVSDGEIRFLQEKFGDDFAMPVRCKPCREENKKRKAERGKKPNGGGPRRSRR